MRLIFCLGACAVLYSALAADWPQFRGPNASGVSDAKGLPVEFGPQKNVIWKTSLPPGHSSPVMNASTIWVTAVDNEKLFVIALDRATGKIQWRREVPRERKQELHKSNGAASPSVVTDGKNAYAMFGDFGLVSYGPDGNERWRMPLGPFNNPMGVGASPILAGKMLLVSCDQEAGSYFLAIDKDTGKTIYRIDRAEFTRGFSTPVLYQPPSGPQQVILAGSYQLTSYEVATGKPVWWVNGLTWQLKPTPVFGKGIVYVQGWAGGSDTGQQEDIPVYEEVLKVMDTDKNGILAKAEVTDQNVLKDWRSVDLDDDGTLNARDWKLYRSRRRAQNALLAVKLGGTKDITNSVAWQYQKSLPNVPSPLYYQDIVYMLKEGGILTALDAATGKVLKQGRVTGALDPYFASPLAADGKIYAASEHGKVAVIAPGAEWSVLAVNDLGEPCYATPAAVDRRLYIRTQTALYCFGERE